METGFHSSHEQFPPSQLLRLVQAAEQAGFTRAMCSDHFQPWSEEQGQSGYAWSWLGAALQATAFPLGVVTAPGQRYDPAILAQAAATLAEMFPGRLWLALGSGQFLNESITGERWPPKQARNQRLLESAEVMRALWSGESVTHRGSFTVEEARLYTRPETPPLLLGAALTAETARWLGGWADGLITIHRKTEELRPLIEAFREGGGEGKPLYVQVQVSYDPDEERALQGAWQQWRTVILESSAQTQLRHPGQFEAAALHVRPEDMREHVLVSSDPPRFADRLAELAGLGFDGAYVHNVNRHQERFIEVFGEEVLPRMR